MKHQKTIEQEVINFIKRHQLISDGKKILVGLSGGADSVFALHFFNKYQKKYDIEISALHVNHKLRGEEADRDENFCKTLCQNLDIEFISASVNVKALATKYKKSLEEAARILRYKKFNEFCEQTKSDLIVTAHNKDDNTETVLLNFVNGSGLDGISGIPVVRDNIIRPFLCIEKQEIIAYLKQQKIKYIKDSSNEDINFDRNYLRKKIIPKLKKNLNPSLDKVVLNSSEVLKGQKKLLDYFINSTFNNVVSFNDDVIFINIKKLKKYPNEVFGEILKKIFNDHLNIDFSFKQFVKFSGLLNNSVGTKLSINKKVHAHRNRNEILISANESKDQVNFELKVGQQIKIKDKYFSIEKIEKSKHSFTKDKNLELISGDSVSGNFILRNWQSGDRIQLLGMKGTKKISDVLTDLKIKSSEKKKQLVLLNNTNIVWLVGFKISEKYRITNKTKSVLKLCLS